MNGKEQEIRYTHLTLSDRYCIEDLLKLGYLVSKIVKKRGYSETAIKNEIKRNSIKSIYDAQIDHKLYYNRRKLNNNKLNTEY